MNSNKVPFSEWACKARAEVKVKTNGEAAMSSRLLHEAMIIRDRVSRMKKDRARYIRSFTR